MKSTILVTGSAGFIGYHLSAKLLEMDYQVIGIDNFNSYYEPKLKRDRNKILQSYKNYSFFKGDTTNSSFLNNIFKKNLINKICHLAAQAGVRYSISNPYLYEESNIKGFLNILETAKTNQVKDIVYASSSSVYGNNKMPADGFSENASSNNPVSFYGASKKSNELMAYVYHDLYNLNCTGLRFFTVYGPWGRPDMAYFKFTKSILKGEPIDVYNYGNMKRDFTYIDDIIAGVISALEKSYPYEIMNLGNSRPVSLRHFIKVLENEIGVKANLNLLPKQPGDVFQTFANINKAKSKLKFKPNVSIEEGLKMFVSWYKKYYQ